MIKCVHVITQYAKHQELKQQKTGRNADLSQYANMKINNIMESINGNR